MKKPSKPSKPRDQWLYDSSLEWCKDFISIAQTADRAATCESSIDGAIRCLQNARNILKSGIFWQWQRPKVKAKKAAK